MSQNDFNIANQGFPATRADINSALQALASNSAGTAEPSTTYAYQFWYDETNELLKMRNSDNDAWITIGTFDQVADTFTPAGVTTDKIEEGNSSVEVVDTGTGYVAVVVDGVEVARVDANGRLGIGTTSPDAVLHLGGSSNQTIQIEGASNTAYYGTNGNRGDLYVNYDPTDGTIPNSGRSVAGIQLDGADGGSNIRFRTTNANNAASTERMRIDSEGRVAIGDTPKASFTGHSILQVGGQAILGANDGLSTTGQTYLSHNLYYDTSGTLQVFNTGSANEGAIYQQFDGVHAWSNSAQTTGTPSVQERMRINSSGNVLVGTTTSHGKFAVGDFSATGADYGVAFVDGGDIFFVRSSTNVSTNNAHYQFYNTNGNVGSITTSGSSTSYNTSSDYRLKENVVALDNAADRLAQIPVHRFNFIADPDTIVDGFLAHEVQAIVPEAVVGEKDGMRTEQYEVEPAFGEIYTPAQPATYDEEGVELTPATDEVIHSTNVERPAELLDGQQWREITPAVMGEREVPDYQGIDQSKLVPLLTAALQEALQKIDALEARVTALGG